MLNPGIDLGGASVERRAADHGLRLPVPVVEVRDRRPGVRRRPPGDGHTSITGVDDTDGVAGAHGEHPRTRSVTVRASNAEGTGGWSRPARAAGLHGPPTRSRCPAFTHPPVARSSPRRRTSAPRSRRRSRHRDGDGADSCDRASAIQAAVGRRRGSAIVASTGVLTFASAPNFDRRRRMPDADNGVRGAAARAVATSGTVPSSVGEDGGPERSYSVSSMSPAIVVLNPGRRRGRHLRPRPSPCRRPR